MRSSSEASSPSCRWMKPNLRSSKKTVSSEPVSISSKTPEKPPELTRHTRRTRNRGVVLSVSEVRKVAEGLQDRGKPETASFGGKTARRQIALPSPLKPPKTTISDDEVFKLPQKYEELGEFYDRLDSSIRLLRMKGSKPSFANISHKIECLTDRRFTHGHLAQLKYIMPEAVVIKKVLVFDERTSCMEPDLHVTIDPDAVEYDTKLPPESGGSKSLRMRKLFRARLRDFCKSHPEGGEIPEDILPEPFNGPKQDPLSDMLMRPSSSFATETLSDVDAALPSRVLSAVMQGSDTSDHTELANGEKDLSVPVRTPIESLNQQPAVASHMSQSFRRRFSQRSKESGADNAQKKLPPDSFQPSVFPDSDSSLKQKHTFVGTRAHPNTLPAKPSSSDCFTSSSAPPATPSKAIECIENKELASIDAVSTPAKLVSTPSRLMTITPALPPPKRQFMSPDDNSSCSPNMLVRRPPRSRSLKFDTPVKNKEIEKEDYDGRLPIDDDVFDILPENLLQSIREKETKAMEERNPAISQAKRRQKMIASLPKLFNMIHLLFQSISRSVITKEELVSKIISGHCEIVDRREVEEQLNLLLELAPEWISERLAHSGDFLFCINKMVNPESIRTSLEEAK